MTTLVTRYADRSVEATERTRKTARIRSKAKHYLFQQCRVQAPEIYEKIVRHFETNEADGSIETQLQIGVSFEHLSAHLDCRETEQGVEKEDSSHECS